MHQSLADAAYAAGWPGEVMPWTDLSGVALAHEPGSATVSPANSMGLMNGGVDFAISRVMFPGVEEALQDALFAKGLPYLPIGRALAVPVPNEPDVFVISAPTMWLPQDVQGTHNAYHATYAALDAARGVGVTTVLFPGMCTGAGMMPAAEALRQMTQAAEDNAKCLPARWGLHDIAAEQPRTLNNAEFHAMTKF